MQSFDLENDDSWVISNYDILRIESMEIGDSLEGESGNFRILRYKDTYFLFLQHEGKIRQHHCLGKEFDTLEDLLKFLKE